MTTVLPFIYGPAVNKMMKLHDTVVSFLLLGALMLWTSSKACPDVCSCDTTTVTCLSVDAFPRDIPSNTTHLIIRNSSLTQVTSEHFINLTNLQILDLSNNAIQTIGANAFSGMRGLYYISLEGNLLRSIGNHTFGNLSLHRLYLSNNELLRHIDSGAFMNTTVQHLFISNCFLFSSSVEDTVFILRDSLTYLEVSNNRHKLTLDSKAFSGINFQQLILRNNTIDDLSFLRQTNAIRLDLSGNDLNSAVWEILIFMPGLRELLLQDIGLIEINSTIPSNNLVVLDLAQNNITSFTGTQLSVFPNLYTLILEGNGISDLPGDLGNHVPKLIALDVGNNRITSFVSSILDGLSLRVLDLSFNIISSLADDLQNAFDLILEIDLRGNPFHCNCELMWLAEWIRNLPATGRDVEGGACATPGENSGKELRIMRNSEFICKSPVVVLVASVGFSVRDQVILECKAKGDPVPVVRLYNNGSELSTWLLHRSESDEARIRYVIDDFKCSAINNYTCEAMNVAGKQADTVELGSSLVETCLHGWWSTTTQTGVTNETISDRTTNTSEGTTPQSNTTGSGLPGKTEHTDNRLAYIIPIVVCLAIVILFGVCVAFVVWRKKNRKYKVRENQSIHESQSGTGFDNEGHSPRRSVYSANSSPAKSTEVTWSKGDKTTLDTSHVTWSDPSNGVTPASAPPNEETEPVPPHEFT